MRSDRTVSGFVGQIALDGPSGTGKSSVARAVAMLTPANSTTNSSPP